MKIKIFLSILLLPAFISAQFIAPCQNLPELIPFKIGKKFGYIDRDSNLVIPAKFDMAEPFMSYCEMKYSSNANLKKYSGSGYASVIIGDQKFRINSKGDTLCRYAEKDFAMCDVAGGSSSYKIIDSLGKKGIKDLKDSIIIPPVYDEIRSLTWNIFQSLFIVKSKRKFGVVDKENNTILPVEYDEILNSTNYVWEGIGLIKVRKKGRVFFADYCGKEYRDL